MRTGAVEIESFAVGTDSIESNEAELQVIVFKKMGPTFSLLSFFSQYNDKFDYKWNRSLDGVLRIRTEGGRMVGADEST